MPSDHDTAAQRETQCTAAEEETTPNLPADAVSKVLQHLELQQRLSACALVSRSWRADALAVTSTVQYSCTGQDLQKLRCLSAWLTKNGAGVESLTVQKVPHALIPTNCIVLPYHQLSRLQSLRVAGFGAVSTEAMTLGSANRIQAAPAASSAATSKAAAVPDSLAALTALTSLQLIESFADLSPLAACTSLSHLELRNTTDSGGDLTAALAAYYGVYNVGVPCGESVAGALQHLLQLTHLTLVEDSPCRSSDLSDAALLHLSCLQQLRELTLSGGSGPITAVGLAGLPTTLTKLDMSAHSVRYSSSSTPRLQQLTQLQWLVVKDAREFDPALLVSFLQLRHLELRNDILPGAAAGTEALLAVLPELTQLQHLDLEDSIDDPAYGAGAASYSALTASSQLTYLGMGKCFVPFAFGLSQHMFAVGKQCPHLSFLCAPFDLFCHPGSVECMVSCCPGLVCLDIDNDNYVGPRPGFYIDGLSALQQLSGLTQLLLKCSISYPTADAAAARVAHLNTLRVLQLHAHELTVSGLWQLTQLTGLTSLNVSTSDDTVASAGFAVAVTLGNQAPEGSPPDVWQQLEQYCCQGLAAFISM